MTALRKYRLVDSMAAGVNELHCECGQRLWPDCDMSSASICDEFEAHLIDAHGWTKALIDEALAGEHL